MAQQEISRKDNIINAHNNVIINNNINTVNDKDKTNRGQINAQNNWWGSNNGNTKIDGSRIYSNNPVILTLTPTNSTSNITRFTISTNGINIPIREINYDTTGSGYFLTKSTQLESGTSTSTYVTNENETVNINIDNQQLVLKISLINENNTENDTRNDTENNTIIINTTIEVNDLTKEYGTNIGLNGKLLNNNNSGIIGHHVNINLIRNSNNQNKNYDVVTDYTGEFQLPINLAPGTYTAEITYNTVTIGNITYSKSTSKVNIYVKQATDNRTMTVLTTNKFIEEYGAGKSFNGTLQDINKNNLAGQHIRTTLTRTSSGASKTYDIVTDYTGEFRLTINLAKGEYIVMCSYEGIDNYQPSNSQNTITVY